MSKEITLTHPRIGKLISRISEGSIVIPPLQRPYVWNQEKAIRLLESIVSDYPIGSILLWTTKESLPKMRTVGGFKLPQVQEDYPVSYVIDGQQRLTTLYGIFTEHAEVDDTQTDQYHVDPKIFDLYYCFEEGNFIAGNEKENGKNYLPMRSVLHSSKFHLAFKNLDPKYHKVAEEIGEILNDYEVPVVSTEKQQRGDIGEIFMRVNNSGTPLTIVDLMIAWTWDSDFHLGEKFLELKRSLKAKNYETIDDRILLQCLGAIIIKSTRAKDITSIDPNLIRTHINLLYESVARAVDFLYSQIGVRNFKLLPHVQQLVPLAYFFSKKKIATAYEAQVLKTWFWRTAFSLPYRSNTDQKMNEDLVALDELIQTASAKSISLYPLEVTADQLISTKFAQNPLSKALICLLANKLPRDLLTGNLIDTGTALSSMNSKEYHHIFPKAYLLSQGVTIDEANVVANICILPADSNKKISNLPPSEYMPKVSGNNEEEILRSNIIPSDRNIYSANEYPVFLKERAKIIMSTIEVAANVALKASHT